MTIQPSVPWPRRGRSETERILSALLIAGRMRAADLYEQLHPVECYDGLGEGLGEHVEVLQGLELAGLVSATRPLSVTVFDRMLSLTPAGAAAARVREVNAEARATVEAAEARAAYATAREDLDEGTPLGCMTRLLLMVLSAATLIACAWLAVRSLFA